MQEFIYQYRFTIVYFLLSVFVLLGLHSIFKPLVVALVLSYILNRPVTYLEKHHIPRSCSIIFFILFVLSLFVVFVILVVPIWTQQIMSITNRLPTMVGELADTIASALDKFFKEKNNLYIDKIYQQLQVQSMEISRHVLMYVLNMVTHIVSLTNIVFYFLIIPVLSYYLTLDWHKIMHLVSTYLIPAHYRPLAYTLTHQMNHSFFLYLKAESMMYLARVVVYTIVLSIAGLHHAIMVSIVVPFICFIPYIGGVLGFLLIFLVALADGKSLQTLIYLYIVFSVLGVIEHNILGPRLIGKRLGVPPLILILAIVVANCYFGILGLFLAYPITAACLNIVTDLRAKKVI